MSMNKIAIGVDNSITGPTGLCIIRFDTQGRFKHIRSTTMTLTSYREYEDKIPKFWGLNTPDVIFAEDGYGRLNQDAMRNSVRTAAWVEAVCSHYSVGSLYYAALASEWREALWGRGAGNTKRAEAKALSIQYFTNVFGVVPVDDNEADAGCLALYAKQIYLKHLEERIDD